MEIPPLPGRLTWISERTGAPRAVRAAADGADPVDAVGLDGAVFPGEPDPRGDLALFVRSVEDPHLETLWVAPVGGGEPRRVGPEAPQVRNPSWAPDGSFLVVESSHESFRDLYRVERTGETGRLTDAPHGSFEPAVGPNGRVAFVSSRDGDAEIYVMGPRGSSPTRLTSVPGDDMQPAWSPDGATITWLARRDLTVQTWRMDPDGQNARPFRAEPVAQQIALAQAWSPDGTRLAVTVQFGPTDVAIDLLDAQGRVVARIDGPGSDEHPTWSPDSQWLAFTGTHDGQAQPDLYRVDRDGKGLTRITTDPAADWLPRWSR
ncbi:MAG: PD40 domain-containing protein [Alphaproteobacteria bacterium]|nr:PD40 domain-containing protein [Alphaproteobacteria bacterium]